MSDSLHEAVSCADAASTARLIREGADVNAHTHHIDRAGAWPDTTPLHTAARQGYQEIAELLIAAGADPNAKDGASRTPLHHALLRSHADVVDLLIDAGTDVNAPSHPKKDWRPLHYAASCGREPIIERLIRSGADVNAKTLQQRPVLHFVARRNRHVSLLLIRHGANTTADLQGHD